MAIIVCPGCGRNVSDGLPYCPACGHPILEMSPREKQTARSKSGRADLNRKYRWLMLAALVFSVIGGFLGEAAVLTVGLGAFLLAAAGIVWNTFRFSGEETPDEEGEWFEEDGDDWQ